MRTVVASIHYVSFVFIQRLERFIMHMELNALKTRDSVLKWMFDANSWHDPSGSFRRKGQPLEHSQSQKLICLVSIQVVGGKTRISNNMRQIIARGIKRCMYLSVINLAITSSNRLYVIYRKPGSVYVKALFEYASLDLMCNIQCMRCALLSLLKIEWLSQCFTVKVPGVFLYFPPA